MREIFVSRQFLGMLGIDSPYAGWLGTRRRCRRKSEWLRGVGRTWGRGGRTNFYAYCTVVRNFRVDRLDGGLRGGRGKYAINKV